MLETTPLQLTQSGLVLSLISLRAVPFKQPKNQQVNAFLLNLP